MTKSILDIYVVINERGIYEANVIDMVGHTFSGTGKRARVAVRRALREWVRNG